MALLIIVLILLLLLSLLLFSPLVLRADSYAGEFSLRWGRFAKAELLSLPGDIAIRVRIGWWSKYFYPLRAREAKAEKERPEKKKDKKKKSGGGISFRKMRRVLSSFKIRELWVELDTDDYVWNAYLFPIAQLIGPLRRHIRINFEGRNECRLIVENRLWNIALAFLR